MPLRGARTYAAALALILALFPAGAFAQSEGEIVAGEGAPPLAPGGLIAFVDGRGLLSVVDPLSLEVTAYGGYGGGPQRAIFPAWSSDGNRVAAVVGDFWGGRVEVMDVAAGGSPRIALARSDRSPIYLNWSPDDRYLAVLSSAPGGLALDLIEMPSFLSGGPSEPRTLSLGQPFYWIWSRTGRMLMVHRDVLRPHAIVGLTLLDDFEVRFPLPEPGAFQAPALSDSERFIAYAAASEAGGQRVLVAHNPERQAFGEVRERAHLGLVAFAWRPGREQLSIQGAAAVGPATGSLELLDVDSGEVIVLSTANVVGSFWSPDGRWLAAISRSAGGELIAGVGPAELAHVQAQGRSHSLSFIEVDTGLVVGFGTFALSQQFDNQYLPFFDQYSRSHRLWAPDSSALVLPTVGSGGRPLLVRFGIDGVITELVEGDMPAWNVR